MKVEFSLKKNRYREDLWVLKNIYFVLHEGV